MSLNVLLLSLFARKIRFGTDIRSMRIRHQALCNIYINIFVGVCLILLECAVWIVLKGVNPCNLGTKIIPLVCLSLWFLKQGMLRASCITACVYIFLANIIASGYGASPIAGIYYIMADLVLTFFFAYSKQVLAAACAAYAVLFTIYAHSIYGMFATVLTDEQMLELKFLIIAAAAGTTSSSIAFFVQKSIEAQLWEVAHASHQKSENLTKEVLKASQAKDVFLSSLSHEIRNPLNSVKGSIDYLCATVTAPEQLKILESAKLGCEILVNLVNNVLDAAKLRADKMEVLYSEACFTRIIEKLLLINSENMRKKEICAKAKIDKSIPKMLWIDQARVLQILMNLLSNALKFTPAGGRIQINAHWCPLETDIDELLKPESCFDNRDFIRSPHAAESPGLIGLSSVTEFNMNEATRRRDNLRTRSFHNRVLDDAGSQIHSFSESEPWSIRKANPNYFDYVNDASAKGYLKIQLSDTGSGIAADQIPKLFQMFAQAHRSVTNMHGGTGLGLWICRQLCQRMGGDIKLYSELGRGTTFMLYIRVDGNQNQNLPVPRANLAREKPNILIADDYSHNRELHKLLVEAEGACAIVASDGNDVINKFKARAEGYFSFIMMDVLMPDVNGFEAAKLIREWEAQENRMIKVDIYFVSGEYYSEEEILLAFTADQGEATTKGIGHLKKPVDIDQIRTIVQKYKVDG